MAATIQLGRTFLRCTTLWIVELATGELPQLVLSAAGQGVAGIKKAIRASMLQQSSSAVHLRGRPSGRPHTGFFLRSAGRQEPPRTVFNYRATGLSKLWRSAQWHIELPLAYLGHIEAGHWSCCSDLTNHFEHDRGRWCQGEGIR